MFRKFESLRVPEGGSDGFPFAVARLRRVGTMSSHPAGTVLDVERGVASPTATLYGGTLFELTDLAMGVALSAQLGAGDSFITVEVKHSILKPICAGRLCVRGRVTNAGPSTALLECEVRDGDGALVASVTSACLILRDPAGDRRCTRPAGDQDGSTSTHEPTD
jgi:uncharacterized protein (TIGR00369 family)